MRVITGAELRSVLHIRMLVERLRQTFRSQVEEPALQRYTVPTYGHSDASLVIAPAWQVGHSIGIRVETNFPDNAAKELAVVQGVYVLIDGKTGVPQAFVDSGALTRRRTAAASVLAATYLARLDSERLLMVGAGALATELIEAYTTVLPIKHVLVWGRTPERVQRLISRFHRPRFKIEATTDLEGAVRGANVVVCATSATDPVIRGEWLEPGVHLDLIGGVTPEMREIDDEGVRRARVFVDTRAGALRYAGDIIQPLASGALRSDDIAGDLLELTRGEKAGRRFYDQITLFKSVGAALEDLAAAQLAVEMVLHNETLR